MVKTTPSFRWLTGLLVVALMTTLGACGGGGDGGGAIQAPLVRAFSPFMSPIDFNTLQQNPTYTDGFLTVSTDSNYPGKIVVFFQDRTQIDPASVFVGGDPNLGLDLSALQILQYIPGSGNVELPLSAVQVEPDRIICTPASLPLAAGQYSIGVFSNIRNTDGKALQQGPVFHSFTVGGTDSVNPFVVATSPVDGALGVGAGVDPQIPTGDTAQEVADIRVGIFGKTTPLVTIRFNESINAARISANNINVINAGFPPGAGAPPTIPPAPTYPQLKSASDGATLPSNGHEIVWKADPTQGGFPFGTFIEVSIVGAYNDQASFDADSGSLSNPDNASPIADLAGNPMMITKKFSFQTVAPPDLPQNPFPEYAVWWAASDRVGVIDAVNQQGIADFLTGAQTFPNGIPQNVLPAFNDAITTSATVPGFEPTELSIDCRTNGGTCSTWVYAMSPNSGEIVIINSGNSLPVAIISTPQPGGIGNQTGGGQAANVVVVSNSSANTLTTFDFNNVSTGINYVNGPIFIQNVQPTGNTPRTVSVSLPPTGAANRDPSFGGPPVPIIMYADFTDGVVNTTRLNLDAPVKQFNLGANSRPNDVVMSPCINAGTTNLFIAAISQAGLPGEGKVAYYISGPSCSTGVGSGIAADAIIGDLTGFDSPAGLDDLLAVGNGAWFGVAESGAQANRIRLLGLTTGAFNNPVILQTIGNVGANPVAVAHRSSYTIYPLCIALLNSGLCSLVPTCWFKGTEQTSPNPDGSLNAAQDLYICARGAGQVTVVDLVSGLRNFYSPIKIPGVRGVYTPPTQ